MLSMFSFEPSNGVSSLPCWSLEALRGLWCLWVWKKNKVHSQFKRFAIIPCVFIFTMPRPAVWLWKWGSKYLKRGNQMLRELPHDKKTQVFLFHRFFLQGFLKPEESIPPVEGPVKSMEQKTLLNWSPRWQSEGRVSKSTCCYMYERGCTVYNPLQYSTNFCPCP